MWHSLSWVTCARALLGSLLVLSSYSAASAQFCVGDCNRDGRVTADEIVSVLSSGCSAGAPDLTVVDPSQIDSAISNVFADCVGPPPDWQVAYDASEFGYAMSAWGVGDGAVWVVGGQNENGAMLRYEDGGWTEVELGFSVPLLNWVHGTSADDVFAGGNGGTILHYDGTSWSQQETPSTSRFGEFGR